MVEKPITKNKIDIKIKLLVKPIIKELIKPKINIGNNNFIKLCFFNLPALVQIEDNKAPIPAVTVIIDRLVLLPSNNSPAIVG